MCAEREKNKAKVEILMPNKFVYTEIFNKNSTVVVFNALSTNQPNVMNFMDLKKLYEFG